MINLVESEELVSGSELTSNESLSLSLTVPEVDEMPSHDSSRVLNVLDEVGVTTTIHGGVVVSVEVQEIVLVGEH